MLFELLKFRRSIRKFQDKEVEKEKVDIIDEGRLSIWFRKFSIKAKKG